jgi:hypothetical protein
MTMSNRTEDTDWLGLEYNRSGLGEVVRGKCASRLGDSTNIVILDPEVARAVSQRPGGEHRSAVLAGPDPVLGARAAAGGTTVCENPSQALA